MVAFCYNIHQVATRLAGKTGWIIFISQKEKFCWPLERPFQMMTGDTGWFNRRIRRGCGPGA